MNSPSVWREHNEQSATDLVNQILKSAEAMRMRQMVTSGFYDRSRIALWMFEVIGREYDDMALWARNIHLEAFPQTCTWSIAIWEWVFGVSIDDDMPLTQRRSRLLSKKLQAPPINPARIEAVLSAQIGAPVKITQNAAPHTFRVDVDESDGIIYDYKSVIKTLRLIKPSHLSFKYNSNITVEYTGCDYSAGFVTESVKEFFSEEINISMEAVQYDGGAIYDVIRECFYEE